MIAMIELLKNEYSKQSELKQIGICYCPDQAFTSVRRRRFSLIAIADSRNPLRKFGVLLKGHLVALKWSRQKRHYLREFDASNQKPRFLTSLQRSSHSYH